TATPIPRTLSLTLYGDLDVSVLDELPAGRGAIVTAARNSEKLPEIIDFIRKQLDAGRQAYIVYPLVEESEKIAVKSATEEFERWRPLLAPYGCELLHGRIAPEEKDAIMHRFRNRETQVLVATTVIEVGVDVPNANIMLIENAERFGLAQIHQLRGRIGRGEFKSYCILLSDAKEEPVIEKLTILEKTIDGFEIAEADLRMRGPGDMLGTAQSGLPQLKLGDFFRDAEIMTQARGAALKILELDPTLQKSEHAALQERLETLRHQASLHGE
ncbi:MAG: helicase-related protein, partial [Chthoniobacterales bacterium]